MLNNKEEVSVVITQVNNKPAKVTYFTANGTVVPENTVNKVPSPSGTPRFYTTQKK